MNLTFYTALTLAPLGVVVTIEFLGPLAVAVAGSRRLLDGLWVVLAGAGVVLLAENRGETQLAGIVLALVAAALWAAYILLSAALGKRTSDGRGLALGMTLAALVVAPVGLADAGAALFQPWVLAAGLGVALLSSVVPYSLELEALRRMPAKVFGVLMSLEPAVAAIVGLLILGEVLVPVQWLAILLVVIASAGATRMARPEA
jgi:inner membrane transporter RhtA